MAKQSSKSKKFDGRKAARPGKRTVAEKSTPPAPTLDSVVELFLEHPPSEHGRTLSLVSVRFQLESMVRGAKFIDQPNLQGSETESGLPAEELTQALNGLKKVGGLLREVVPGLFLKEPRNASESRQIAIARLALARYLAALEGPGDAQGIMRAQAQMDTLLRGGGILLIPGVPASDGAGRSPEGLPAQPIHLGETPLLDLLLPQWRLIGSSNWVSPLGRHRGNWIEQAFMPVFEFLSKQLLMLFLLRGWPIEAFRQNRSRARRLYFEAFTQVLTLSDKRGIPSRSLYPHLDHACRWTETGEANREMDLLLEMDQTRIRDARRASGGRK